MNAIVYLYAVSLKNQLVAVLRSPKRLLTFLVIALVSVMFVLGAATGAIVSTVPAEIPLLKGVMFVLYLIPFCAGRYGGFGPFSTEHANFIFTAPILPRTVLLAELLRRFWDMVIISFAIMAFFTFMALTIEITVAQILLAGFFCLLLTAVCKLFGMYMFVAYKKVYRWIGFFWLALLLAAGVFYFARAGWELLPGLMGLLDSHVLAFTPLVGWAAAGAFAFIMGQAALGAVYTGFLVAAGGYFFWTVYRSAPDFYDEAVGAPASADTGIDERQSDAPPNPSSPSKMHERAASTSFVRGSHMQPGWPAGPVVGAAAFFHKHLLEESGGWSTQTRIPWLRGTRIAAILDHVGLGILGGMAFSILWGLYARGFAGEIELAAMLFRIIGVPSGNILAVLIPSILLLAAYPQYDKGFMELYNPHFYLVPDSPMRKLIWVSMARIINVCAVAVLVIGLAGVVSGTSPIVTLAAILAYFAAAFMVLGLRLAIVRVLGVVSGGRQKLVATLPVMVFVLVGVVGMLATFYFGPERWGILAALLGFVAWCGLVGALGFGFSLRVLHDVDAPV